MRRNPPDSDIVKEVEKVVDSFGKNYEVEEYNDCVLFKWEDSGLDRNISISKGKKGLLVQCNCWEDDYIAGERRWANEWIGEVSENQINIFLDLVGSAIEIADSIESGELDTVDNIPQEEQ